MAQTDRPVDVAPLVVGTSMSQCSHHAQQHALIDSYATFSFDNARESTHQDAPARASGGRTPISDGVAVGELSRSPPCASYARCLRRAIWPFQLWPISPQ